ncbi:hypothetical protein V6N13_059942 [Hibiscus sabdariffa]|uniref:Uncharacterized protein n=2 Tax=Hibiscus sabdariffa TaxID=183260 RepID=A0ABR1Z829_9ROSI
MHVKECIRLDREKECGHTLPGNVQEQQKDGKCYQTPSESTTIEECEKHKGLGDNLSPHTSKEGTTGVKGRQHGTRSQGKKALFVRPLDSTLKNLRLTEKSSLYFDGYSLPETMIYCDA